MIATFCQLCEVYEREIGVHFPGKDYRQLLAVLKRYREHPLTQGQLAEMLAVKQPAAAKWEGQLRSKGFVEECPDASSQNALQLSELGRTALDTLENDMNRVLLEAEKAKLESVDALREAAPESGCTSIYKVMQERNPERVQAFEDRREHILRRPSTYDKNDPRS